MIKIHNQRSHCGCHFGSKTHVTSGVAWQLPTFYHCQHGRPNKDSLAHDNELSKLTSFHDDGPSMIWDSRYSCWVEPNVDERENIMWFHIYIQVLGLSKVIKDSQSLVKSWTWIAPLGLLTYDWLNNIDCWSIHTHPTHVLHFYHACISSQDEYIHVGGMTWSWGHILWS
jgi:hypothetical protein